jgi:cyclopropane-fatty-acyl-phospholipid synthase
MWLFNKFIGRMVKRGPLTVKYATGETQVYGAPDPAVKPVTVRFADKGVPNFIARNPKLNAAEAFLDGRLLIEQGDIRDLLNLIRVNGTFEDGKGSYLRGTLVNHLKNITRSKMTKHNFERQSKKNVAHHYDLSDRLYDLFLDADRQYSCAYFTDPSVGLEQAQLDKKTHIAAKLYLKPGQRVLDIGCGWGGLAFYLHQLADVDVLGITLSQEQLAGARERAAATGVGDRVTFELLDYRDVRGTFDRIVSVGMFEHVGPPNYRSFFERCRALLSADGVMLLHTIGRADEPAPTDRWLARYIFPGGYVPALSQIAPAIEDARLWISDLEILRLHYAYTLSHWYERVVSSRDAIIALYDERFFRMWQFYLAGAIVAFRHDAHLNFQIQLSRRRETLPLVRDYMVEAEKTFIAKVTKPV